MTSLKNLEQDHHIRQIDIQDTFFDLLLFRDLRIENILYIFKNLYKDKPLTLVLFLAFAIFLFNFKKNNFELNYYFFIITTNIGLILLLYISVWRTMELESPIRFILNLYLLIFIFISRILDSNKKLY